VQTTTSTSAATPNYSCPTGYSLSGTACVYSSSNPATPVYACPAGFTLSGTTCSGSSTTAATSSWDCKGYGSLQPLSGSPSGYYCVARALPPQNSDACPDIAASLYGLAYAGYRQTSNTTGTCYVGPVAKYSCPAGATLSGTTCTTSVTQAATVSSYTCSAGTLSGTNCVTSSSTAASVTYSCPAGQQLSGATCTASNTSTVAGTPYYSCPAGYTLSGTSCSISGTATQAATASFSCASGTLSGVNCTGALTRTRYEAYGNAAAGTVPSGIGFTGHVNDPDTGLVYMQQRYYDPMAARFMSVDPVTTDANNGALFNRYEYAQSNPYRYVDPDGRAAIVAVAVPTLFILGAHYVLPGREAREQSLRDFLHSATGGESKPSTLSPGPNGKDSIPARGPGRDFNPEERAQNNANGDKNGCHTCGTKEPGTKSGDWIPDHQPPSGLNESGGPQRLYPHCKDCSRTQGGQVNGEKTRGQPKAQSSGGGESSGGGAQTQQQEHKNLFDGPKSFGRIS